jgi:hypothetical protein
MANDTILVRWFSDLWRSDVAIFVVFLAPAA